MSKENPITKMIDDSKKITELLLQNSCRDKEIINFIIVTLAYLKANMPLLYDRVIQISIRISPHMIKEEEK